MLVRELPSFYDTVCEAIGHLEKCVEYYTSFVGFVAQRLVCCQYSTLQLL